MKGYRPFFLLVCLLVSGFFCQMAIAAEICNRIVAIVNSEVITLHELNAKIRELTGLDPADLRNQDEKAYLENRRKILDILIDEKIALEKIRELGIEASPMEVDKAIERIKEQNNLTHEDLIAGLEREGVKYDAYRESIKNDLERRDLLNFEVKSKIIIREEKIREYYEQHKDEFRSEERVRLAAILLTQEDPSNQDEIRSLLEKAKEIVLKLKNGEDFGELAREYSRGPGAEEGGDLGFFETSQLDPELIEIIERMSVGDISEPIVRPPSIQIVKLVEKEDKGIKPFGKVRNGIYGIFYQEEVNERYSSWIKKLRESAYVKIVF
ncbi:MAG: peptidylprolyl isomerase [Thermodesulfobacteriota bacterium]|nr:peptidylprolyl isomerase [Thermodesulfobacteriota bacterium]